MVRTQEGRLVLAGACLDGGHFGAEAGHVLLHFCAQKGRLVV